MNYEYQFGYYIIIAFLIGFSSSFLILYAATHTKSRWFRRHLGELFEVLHNDYMDVRKDNMPKRIILIRHGESEGNKDATAYGKNPDNQIPLSLIGIEQAREAGKKLKEIVKDESCFFYISPYNRTRQTFQHIVESSFIDKEQYKILFEPRIREQDFGNFQNEHMDACIEERRKFGPFFYRFPEGEAATDVYDRVSSFWDSLFRKFEKPHCEQNLILITHGITARVFVTRYYKWDVEKFYTLKNPDNCQLIIMEKTKDFPHEDYKLLNEESLLRH